jgi:hypothetical protein
MAMNKLYDIIENLKIVESRYEKYLTANDELNSLVDNLETELKRYQHY